MSFVVDKRPSNIHLPQTPNDDLLNINVKSYQNINKNIQNDISAWVDPDDEDISIDLSSKPKLKKLRREGDLEKTEYLKNAVIVDGLKYQARLRDQFEKIHPIPNWIKPINFKDDHLSDFEDEIDFVYSFRSTKKEKYVNSKKISVKNSLDVSSIRYLGNITKTLPKATSSALNIDWHPSGTSIVTGGNIDKTIRVFSLSDVFLSGSISDDSALNQGEPQLVGKEVVIEAFPITCVKWMPSGNSVFVSGMKKYFYIIDLETHQATPYSSFGKYSGLFKKKDHGGSIGSVVSISNHNLLAVGEGNGYIAVFDSRSLRLITRLKSSDDSGISAVEWDPVSPYPILWSLEGYKVGSTLSQWDLRATSSDSFTSGGYGGCINRTPLHTAGLRGKSMSISPSGRNISIGTDLGITAILGPVGQTSSLSAFEPLYLSTPVIVKEISSLRTPIDSLSWSSDGNDFLAFSSSQEKGATRIASITHTSTGGVAAKTLQGWPSVSMMPALNTISCVKWSPFPNYLLAVSNSSGKVHLFGMDK